MKHLISVSIKPAAAQTAEFSETLAQYRKALILLAAAAAVQALLAGWSLVRRWDEEIPTIIFRRLTDDVFVVACYARCQPESSGLTFFGSG
jgi:hypothetical protein